MNNKVMLSARQTDFLRESLPENIFHKALKYRRWQDRQAYLGGRYLLLEGLKKLLLPTDMLSEIRYTKYDRPYLPLNIDFNISHSGEFILCAISDKHRIGIDIEEIQMIDINDFRNQFTEQELLSICNAPDSYREFFRFWTIKEAVMKADGRGVGIDLKSILITKDASLDGQLWYIKEIKVSSEYMAHMATNSIIADQTSYNTITIPEF